MHVAAIKNVIFLTFFTIRETIFMFKYYTSDLNWLLESVSVFSLKL